MLNRRILRAKAMQGLYAFYKSQEANFNLALDYISDKYAPDLNSMEPIDRTELNKRKQSALKVFHQNFRHDSFEQLDETEKEEEHTAWEAFRNYNFQNQKDFDYFSKQLVKEVEKIYDRYLWLLQLILELADIEQNDARKLNENKGLCNNLIIGKLEEDDLFHRKIEQKHLSWNNEKDLVSTWYRSIIKPDQDYNEYLKKGQFTLEQDIKISIHIYKDLLFKSDQFNTFLETEDINWTEDKHILKSMIQKTLKNVNKDQKGIQLASLSNNWEEDLAFFIKLFEITVKNDKEYETLIADKSKNWDVERMAIMDKIILKMAIGEMIHFPSIPIKVSINEYIELSKNFSTPKSKKFVNGILDVLSEELKEQGVIKKSGRGLIDNK